MTKLTFAGVKTYNLRQYLQQGGFTSTIWPNQNDSLMSLNLKVQRLIHLEITVSLGQFLESNHPLTASTGLGKGELDLLRRNKRGVNFFHPFNLLEFALRLGGLCVLGTEPVHKLHQPLDLLLLVFIGSHALRLVCRALYQVRFVIARVARRLPSLQFHNVTNQKIQKLPVMGDQQNGSGVILQITLQPNQRIQVKMVRRLIEHEQIRFHH